MRAGSNLGGLIGRNDRQAKTAVWVNESKDAPESRPRSHEATLCHNSRTDPFKGIGIPEEDQQQLFKAFHRGSNVGTLPGPGLGLMLVKRCADLHGGKVQIVSKFGEGTTVTVRFPAL